MSERAVEPRQATILSHLIKIAARYMERPALTYKRNHYLARISYKRLLNLIATFGSALTELGVGPGDRIGIISENRPEWVVADLAGQSLGAIIVPIHKTLPAAQVSFILQETHPSVLLVSDGEAAEKAASAQEMGWKCGRSVIFEDPVGNALEDAISFEEALRTVPHGFDLVEVGLGQRINARKAGDVVTIIYTSDTTGKLKGVELTAANIATNVEDIVDILRFTPEDRFLSVLPLSHIFERTAGYYVPLFSGASVIYMTDLSALAEVALEEKPTMMAAVPRLLEKVAQKAGLATSKSRAKKVVFDMAISYGARDGVKGTCLHRAFDKLVYSKVRESLGGKLRYCVSGGAALKLDTGLFFEAIGVPILEGYGLAETSPVISLNRLECNHYGTVGRPLPRTKVKIGDGGEVLVKGPGVMKGYYRDPKATKVAFEDGWLKTGDLGTLDAEGFLRLTGRRLGRQHLHRVSPG